MLKYIPLLTGNTSIHERGRHDVWMKREKVFRAHVCFPFPCWIKQEKMSHDGIFYVKSTGKTIHHHVNKNEIILAFVLLAAIRVLFNERGLRYCSLPSLHFTFASTKLNRQSERFGRTQNPILEWFKHRSYWINNKITKRRKFLWKTLDLQLLAKA